MNDRTSSDGADRPERETTPQRSAGVRVLVALALLAVPLLPILCLSGLSIVVSLAPSEPCRPPFVVDQSDCGPEPLAVLSTSVLAGGYAIVAFVLALRVDLPSWVRIGALCLAPLAAVPLLLMLFV
ncbi:hypothetical protein O7614_15545 [Micromonospora sp. WMMD961]|uniref:hypothetical protein n=1 Tax=Micromonospora sp. WMMD961 TaxID=3016100 RepID=UPI002417BB27|nr:hypothetical protein [Micromonospora sp. WMMD961]MDG4781061.1 hypothetical protein [Micromonospora sp. WMMD961]